MIIVTGAAGFVGSNNVKALNDQGLTDIIAVDNLAKADKFRNLADSRNCRLPRQARLSRACPQWPPATS